MLRLLEKEGFARTSGVMPQVRRTSGTDAGRDAPVTLHLPRCAGYRAYHIALAPRILMGGASSSEAAAAEQDERERAAAATRLQAATRGKSGRTTRSMLEAHREESTANLVAFLQSEPPRRGSPIGRLAKRVRSAWSRSPS